MTNHPKIGIRPIIDGRRGGIRESLEEMTMGMAQSVAKLYAAKLRYADGAPVECVIADTTIGGVAEAAAATDKFRDNNVGAVLSVTPCWCYGSETIDMDPLMPKAIWGFNKTQRPGAVYLASALAGHNQIGLPAFGIYGSEVQEQDDNSITPDVEEKLLRFGRAAVAVMEMRGKSYLSIGSVSMGIWACAAKLSIARRWRAASNWAFMTRRSSNGLWPGSKNTARRTKARTSTRNTSAIRAKRKTRCGSMWSK